MEKCAVITIGRWSYRLYRNWAAAVYAASVFLTCARVGEMNERAIPTFEISCFGDRVVDSDGCVFRLGRSMRI